MQRNTILALVASACAVVAIAASPAAKLYLKERFIGGEPPAPNVITVWHPWGGTNKDKLEKTARIFEKSHPGLKVNLVFVSNNLGAGQKFFTSVAAGKAPDVTFVDGPQVPEWAVQGAIQSLNKYIKRDKVNPDDFYKPCWDQNIWDGHTYAMTFCADPNFAFAWNNDVMKRAGLPVNTPPTTIEEMDAYNDKMIKRAKTGRLTGIGIIPWAQFGGANSVFTWGWAFGGDFYDAKNRKIIADKTKVMDAFKWMMSYAKKYDATKIASLSQGFGSLEQDPFYTGTIGMRCFHIFQINDQKTYAPNLNYGLGYIPYPKGGEKKSSWVGGWCMALPRGCKNPDNGWEFIRWMCASKEGTYTMGTLNGLFPGMKTSPYFDTIKNDPKYGVFLEVMNNCKHQRPVMPAQSYFMQQLERACDQAVNGIKTPEQALRDAVKETQAELDLRLKGK